MAIELLNLIVYQQVLNMAICALLASHRGYVEKNPWALNTLIYLYHNQLMTLPFTIIYTNHYTDFKKNSYT